MSLARVFLLGSSGWLGAAISRSVPGVVAISAVQDLSLFELSDSDTVVNAAGSKDPVRLRTSNSDLVEHLIRTTERSGAHLVHLGSAAEYGVRERDHRFTEQDVENPGSQYGASKLAATRMMRDSGRATVLRLFNIADSPPQPGSPLEEILQKVRVAAIEGRAPSLLSAGTVRDWVTRDFVVASVLAAVARTPIGVFNVCSGVGLSMGALATTLLVRRGLEMPVHDLQLAPADTVVGDPSAWMLLSGMSQRMTAQELAALLVPDGEDYA